MRGQYNHLLVKDGGRPDWSVPTASAPDGRIVFARSFGSCAATGLYTIKPDGTGEKGWAFGCESAFDPSWSPDGTKLAFASYAKSGPHVTHIFVGLLSNGRRSQITNKPTYEASPAWSPNGKQIAFSTNFGNDGLFLVKPSDPFAETAIPKTKPVTGALPDWQPR